MKNNRKKEKTWMKNHPMEGDDIITSFYDLLCKRDPKTMKPCRNVFVPDTVVYEHNFPRGWYTTDVKAKEVMRRQGKDLDAATIEYGFSRDVADNFPIVATYLSIHEENLGNGVTETTTRVQVLNKEDIGAFVSRKSKNNGILQRFVFPKGYHNSVIKVVWSPRIAIIQRRKNKYPIKDRKRAEIDPFAITVTYEGPEYLSEESGVSAHVAFEVKNVCAEIIKHFFHTEHKYITRMVLYFKGDGKDRLWLLWCGSLRVAERIVPSNMPMNLAPRFGEPVREGSLSEQEMLRRVDKAYYVITRDGPFYEAYIRGGDSHSIASSGKRSLRGGDTRDRFLSEGGDSEFGQPKRVNEEGRHPAQLRGALDEMKSSEDMVQDAFRDIFYNAYSHFLSATDRPFDVVVPPAVVNVLTPASIAELMKFLKLGRKLGRGVSTQEGAGKGAADGGEAAETAGGDDQGMVFVIPEKFYTPLSMLSNKAEEWIKAFFNERRGEVKKGFEGFVEGKPPSEGGAADCEEPKADVNSTDKPCVSYVDL